MPTRLQMTVALLIAAGLTPAATDAGAPAGPRCRSTAGIQASGGSEVAVGTFNVLHGLTEAPPDYPAHSTLDARVSLAAAAIADAGVDVVGLQEVSLVEPNPPGSEHPPTMHVTTEVVAAIADELAASTGERWHWCWWLANPYFTGEPDLNEGGGGPLSDESARLASEFVSPQYASFKEGLAILSRYAIVDSDGIHLPGRLPAEIPLCPAADDPGGCVLSAGFERRAAIWARVSTPIGLVDLTNTHLAHDITKLSDASALEQVLVVLAFAHAKSSADGAAVHRFLTCDCSSERSDTVPIYDTIRIFGYVDTRIGDCPAVPADCTAGGDVIVTSAPSRTLTERLDYVFMWPGCSGGLSSGAFADTPVPDGGGRWLWPSDHVGQYVRSGGCS